jgi:ABC-type dipeptide/oligopeptide/nickel transport system permease subunit
MSTALSPLVVPSLFLFGTVVCLNLLGDGLRNRWGTG